MSKLSKVQPSVCKKEADYDGTDSEELRYMWFALDHTVIKIARNTTISAPASGSEGITFKSEPENQIT
jgi:hypothetical protein